jgi:hypothetical protein
VGKLAVTAFKQQHENSCWAACIRMVLYYDKLFITSDDSLANRLGVVANKCQNIQPLMEKCGMYDSTDDEDVKPPFDTIVEEIGKGRPIIQCMSTSKVKPGASSADGHYVLIIGAESDGTLHIIDPSTGTETKASYANDAVAIGGSVMFYAQPYYTQKARPF